MNRGSRFFIAVSLVVALLSPVAAHARSVLPTEMTPVARDPKRLTAGDVLELRVRLPDGTADLKPNIAPELANGPVKIGKNGRVLWWKVDDQDRNMHVFGVTTYLPGELEIPALQFGDQFETEPKKATYESVGKGEGDIYPPLMGSVPVWFVYTMLVLALVALCLITYFTWKWMKRRRALRDALKSAPRILTPYEELEEVCQGEEVKRAIREGKYKRCYFAVSEALKYYLSRVHKFNAEECTTRELFTELQNIATERPFLDRWKELFQHMDLIKFTDTIPSENQLRGLPSEALKLGKDSWDAWQRTQPQFAVPSEGKK